MIKNWIIYLVAEKLRELELFGLEKVGGDRVNVYESLMVCNREEGDRHFSVLSSDKRKNKRHTLKCKKFHSNIRKNSCSCVGFETLAQVAQQSFGVSGCGLTQNLTGHIPGQPTLADHAWSRRCVQVISRGLFQPQQSSERAV